jgi:hypothetical protein
VQIVYTASDDDKKVYNVAAIRGHDGTYMKKANLKFLVHWEGCPDSTDTWEPYRALRQIVKLHEYLRAHRLATLIPQAHK